MLPVLRAFTPQLLYISAGFDAAEGDAQGRMLLTPAGFAHMARRLLSVRGCGHVAVLEGGYHVEASTACAEAVLAEMIEHDHAPAGQATDADADADAANFGSCAEHTPTLLRELIEAHGEFWPCLVSEAHRARVDAFFSRRRPRVRRERSTPEPPKPRKKQAGREKSV